ncbi:NADH:flavin oxidoreductase/NADH oxidase [Kitasatospora paracochleata]|uniref:2,4-dienoyl-CoA reductase-like NADH-dependent reductase (Old Yellow Enzyme family) n=1 Tax=Kitasatospora paracochleata TaxID=58354 RepID=A0ABT1J4Z4_9ACTN|nr:NADH:flavin oxidoreductase/NADH oxidase [Kitasatospora paracochleata]MCP2312194.1 2,4-dienoyl-CoA reductase-like NADH-dependent reductase (Old Yellow Enzyme family) [Kitasatospora paracochleata]
MSALFEPITLRSLTIPNRVWMSPMCMYSAAPEGPDEGVATDFHLAHLGARAAGGAGLVMVEATGVVPQGRISPWDLGLWNDRQQEQLARIAALIASHGAVPAVQLAHAGRKASTRQPWVGGGPLPVADGGWAVAGAAPVAFGDGYPVPHELSVEEIRDVVTGFADAARRALAAGIEVVEVHGAHGYLIHQFLSPVANRRTDGYGGSFAGRARLALEVAAAVRTVWPADLPVFFRLSATDWLPEEPSWTVEESVLLAKELQAVGIDLIDVSSGGMSPNARIEIGPGYQVPFAERIRTGAGLPVSSVGLITEPAQAEAIVADGRADAVMLGRELLRDPYWPLHAARELGAERHWPRQYGFAVGSRG